MVRYLALFALLTAQSGCKMYLVLRPDLSTEVDRYAGRIQGAFYSGQQWKLGPYQVTITDEPATSSTRLQVALKGEVKTTVDCTGGVAGSPSCVMTDQGVQWQGVFEPGQNKIVFTAPNGGQWVVEAEFCSYGGQDACGYYLVQNEASIGALDVLMGRAPTLWIKRDVPNELQAALVAALAVAHRFDL